MSPTVVTGGIPIMMHDSRRGADGGDIHKRNVGYLSLRRSARYKDPQAASCLIDPPK